MTPQTTCAIPRAYALNQWKPNFDDFTRVEQHLRAFKVLAACGFTGIELRAGTGRWDPLGRPASIAANYGSTADFVRVLADLGIGAVTSWTFDPGDPIDEDLSRGRSILAAGEHAAIADTCRGLAAFLAEAGGSRLVVRALPSAWRTGALAPGEIATAAEGWTAVGRAVAEYGVKVSLHVDALSAASDASVLDQLLAHADPDVVGMTLDTGEMVLAGLSPVAIIGRYPGRIDHVHLKDTAYVDAEGERLLPHAEQAFLQEGGTRGIERWFLECGTPGGIVDIPGVVSALDRHAYDGWLVFESDPSPNPARSAMLNGWYATHVLGLAQ
jgi:inosose dehydratase